MGESRKMPIAPEDAYGAGATTRLILAGLTGQQPSSSAGQRARGPAGYWDSSQHALWMLLQFSCSFKQDARPAGDRQPTKCQPTCCACPTCCAGERQDDMVAQVPKSQAPEGLKPGSVVQLTNGMQVGRGWGRGGIA